MYCFFYLRVFGHFERPIFLELCKFLESKIIPSDAYVFRIGDADDSLYVVQKGLLHVFITDEVRLNDMIWSCFIYLNKIK